MKRTLKLNLVSGELNKRHGGGRGVFVIDSGVDTPEFRDKFGFRADNKEAGRFFFSQTLNFFSVDVEVTSSTMLDGYHASAFAHDESTCLVSSVSDFGTDDVLAVRAVAAWVADNQQSLHGDMKVADFN